MLRRNRRPTEAAPSQPEPPPLAVLFSEYDRARPRPAFEPAQSVAAMLYVRKELDDERHRFALSTLFERHAPAVAAGSFSRNGTPTREGQELMSQLVIQRLEEVRSDPRFRQLGYPQEAAGALFRALSEFEYDHEVLDIAGAWLDAYARLPNVPWLLEAEERYAADLDRVLQGTSFALRGREIVRREDLGSERAIEQPLRVFLVDRPELRPLDDKLREAQQELDAGNSADAITDAGTALQLLLAHLGHKGSTLGDQIKTARREGLFTGVDAKLGTAVENLSEWVASVRNQRGDAHPSPQVDLADAQLVFRIVVTLVLRLA